MDRDEFVGIIDAHKVLEAPLPPHRRTRRAASVPAEDSLEVFRSLLPRLSDAILRDTLAQLLDVQQEDLESHLAKLGLEIAMQLATDQRLLRDFEAQARDTVRLKLRARNSTTRRTMKNLTRRFSVMTISPTLKKALKRPLN